MKTNLKFVAALLCFYFASTVAFAQKVEPNKEAFIGIWELYMMASGGQPLHNTGPGYLKIFNADGTFTIVKVQNTGSIIKQHGQYIIDDVLVYREKALDRVTEKLVDPADPGFKINYEFSEDKKLFTIKYSYNDGASFTEVYQRL
jgi:hypothetical protein